jgi:hypothetical protein
MKIDESCINHNALRLIKEALSDPYYLCSSDTDKTDEANFRMSLMTIGEANGVIAMANAMKEVLKT